MIKKTKSVKYPFQPLVPREYINAAIIEAGKWNRYICRKIWVEPKGDTNAIMSRRYGFILAKFGFSARAVEAAREWLANRHTAKRKRFINDRIGYLYDQLLTPRLPVWKHYRLSELFIPRDQI